MRILLVEDDPVLGAGLQKQLQQSAYAVDWVQSGLQAFDYGSVEPYDLCILDLGLPDLPGLDLLEWWRKHGCTFPVIVLTARGTWQEKVSGLQRGADDYMVKPFQIEELLARMSVVIKRSSTAGTQAGVHPTRANDFGLDLNENTQSVRVHATGDVHVLTRTEFSLLRLFVMHPNRLLSKSWLTDHLYDMDSDKDSNVLEVYVRRLRTKIGDGLIQTRRGQGYVFGKLPV
ncbi:MAG: response regulator transcription factor [Limnobacter sp.]|nr:response regulator transcription factor [Limnobacter sp.]